MLSNKSMLKTDQNTQELPELLSLKEASEILKCHPNTLRQWDNKGILKAVRFGERQDRRYRKEDILKFIKKNI
jgi:excisionase family DNA binding protein